MHSRSESLKAAWETEALVYSVDMGTPVGSHQKLGNVFLRQLSDATGGRYLALRSLDFGDAATALNALLANLRASYVVTYDLPNHQAGFHSLRLEPTHNLNLTFHSRNGYYYDPLGNH